MDNMELGDQNSIQEVQSDFTPLIITISIIIISSVLFYIYYKIKTAKKPLNTNTLLFTGPINSGKTTFFYSLLNNSIRETVSSIKTNKIENINLQEFEKPYTLLDLPGQLFYRKELIENIGNSKVIITFLDSSEKKSISEAGEYLFDIINSDKFSENIPLIIACNKQDLNYAKAKKIIETDLTSEIENIKKIKQSTTLEETQFGTLSTMKVKFSFSMFKNIQFVETTRNDNFETLKKKIIEVLK